MFVCFVFFASCALFSLIVNLSNCSYTDPIHSFVVQGCDSCRALAANPQTFFEFSSLPFCLLYRRQSYRIVSRRFAHQPVLLNVTRSSPQTETKAAKMFAQQQFDHSFNDLFNQYVNMESSGVDGNKDVSFPSGDLDQLFPLDSLSNDCGDLSPTVPTSSSKRSRQPSQPWSQDFWGLPQDTASSTEQGSFSFHDTVQPSAVSDLSLNLDAPSSSSQPAAAPGLLSASLSTPPQTPRKKACTGSGITTPKSIRHQPHHRTPSDRRDMLRKQSFSPSLMHASQPQKAKMAYSEASAQGFQNFTLHNSDNSLPLSPPPSDILVQRENLCADNAAHMNRSSDQFPSDSTEMSQQYDSSVFNQSPAISMPSPSANALARQQQRYVNQRNSTTLGTASPPSDDIFSSPPSSGSHSLSSWYSDSLGTSTLPFTPDLSSHDAQAWWSPMTSRVAQRQPSYQQQMMGSQAPQRPIQNAEQHNDMLQGGLMIQFDPSFDMSASADPTFPSSTMSSSAPTTAQETQSYNQLPTTPQKFMNPSFATPQIQNQSPWSPSLSPKTSGVGVATTSPKNRSTSTVMKTTPHRRSYDRKMPAPSTTPKPVKTPNGSSNRGSPRGSAKSVSVSFVNFTPSDSKRILTGVAPSGSSKTKARREQEARDRRRRLGEAALQAVQNAGGDVDSLEAVLC